LDLALCDTRVGNAILVRLGLMDLPNPRSFSTQQLKDRIAALTIEEERVSRSRRAIQGEIDVLRAELVNRVRGEHSGDTGSGGSGVREPLGPRPASGASGIALPLPDSTDELAGD
jgi:hypothetical protein